MRGSLVHALRVTADHRSIGTEAASIRAKRGGFLNHSSVEGAQTARHRIAWEPLDADLRIRMRGVRRPLRRAGGGGRGRPAMSELRRDAGPAPDLELRPDPAPAARGKGPLRRIAASREANPDIRSGSPAIEPNGRRANSLERDGAEERREALVELFNEVKGCTRCPLHETRTKAVFGAGNADADLMFVGEAPGAEEDRQGLPFVGRAGQLLNQMLEGIGLSREDVFIANVLKSRPPGNRDPQPLEIEACRPYLFEQVRLIEPKVVCTLGNFATKLLSGNPAGITRVRGTPQVHELGGRAVFLLPLFHPAAALRTPGGQGDPARRLRDDPGPARGAAAGPGARAPRRSPSWRPRAVRPRHRRSTSSTCSDTSGRRADRDQFGRRDRGRSGRGSPPGSSPARRRRLRRARRRQDDPDPRRLPGTRSRGARDLADLHDRAALSRATGSRSPTSTSTGCRGSRTRTRRCSTTI